MKNKYFNFFDSGTFVSSVAIFFGGTMASKVINGLTLLLLGFLLSPSDFGQYALFLMFVGFISVFTTFGLRSGIMRIPWEDKVSILSNSLLISLILSILVSVIILLLASKVIYFGPEKYHFLIDYLWFLVIKSSTTSFSGIVNTYYVSNEKPKTFVQINIISSLITFFPLALLTILGVPIISSEILNTVILLQTISGICAVIYSIYISKHEISIKKITINQMVAIAKLTWVFFVKQLIGFFQSYAGLIVLSIMATSELLGIYSYFTILLTHLSSLQSVFFKAYTPKIKNLVNSQKYPNIRRAIGLVNKSSKAFSIFAIFLLTVTFIFIQFLKNIEGYFINLSGYEYIANIELLFWMLFVLLLGTFRSFYDIWQYTQNKFVNRYILTIQCINLPLLYFGSVFLFSKFNIYGIIVNQGLIYIFLFVINILLYRKLIFSDLIIKSK